MQFSLFIVLYGKLSRLRTVTVLYTYTYTQKCAEYFVREFIANTVPDKLLLYIKIHKTDFLTNN